VGAVWLILVLQVIVPLGLAALAWRQAAVTRLHFFAAAALACAFTGYVTLAGRWDFIGHSTRWTLLGLVTAAVLLAWRRSRRRPMSVAQQWRRWVPVAFMGVLAVYFLGGIATGLWARRAPQESVALQFPLREGWFHVGHGGNHVMLNAHQVVPSQRFAVDIVALSAGGWRARGLRPLELPDYYIWGAVVHSPCDGMVVHVVDGLPDLPIGERDGDRQAGNHVVIRKQGAEVLVLLAHLQQGSVRVAEGDQVRAGDPIGRVGNSGNTSEPHLHVHALRGGLDALRGTSVPMRFDGRFLVRNDTVRTGTTHRRRPAGGRRQAVAGLGVRDLSSCRSRDPSRRGPHP
jgi:hypothetical protein